MHYAFLVETPRGWFAHKILAETVEDAERRVKAQYHDLKSMEKVRGGPNDDKDNGHALYDRALVELAKKPKKVGLFD